MKRLNKKGFTLVELLAVIVVLAVLVLIATTAVVPRMNRARKEAFKTEVSTIYNAALEYFAMSELTATPATCADYSKLVPDYLAAKGLSGYQIKIKKAEDNNGNIIENKYDITIDDGKNYRVALTETDLGTNVADTDVVDHVNGTLSCD